MRSYLPCLIVLTALTGLLAPPAPPHAAAAEWGQWRGPNFDGSSDARNLPDAIGADRPIAWKTVLPGAGNGTPVVFGDRVFTTALTENKELAAICLNLKDGRILWRKDVGIGFQQKGENNMATPSPVTDGKTVWFLFGTGDLAAFDIDGKPLWSRNLQKEIGPFNIMWIYGSSPLLYKDKLYIQVLHRDQPYRDTATPGAAQVTGPHPSYLLALEPATGKEIWKQVRPEEAAGESKEAYTTPIPHTTPAGREEVVLVGGDAVTGHDPQTGKELWRYAGWNPSKVGHWRIVPSAVTGAGVIVACAPKGGPVMAIKADANGDLTDDDLAWKTKEFTSDVCVPLFYKDAFYVLDTNARELNCVEPKSGKVKWKTKLGGAAVFRASPTGADGKVYCMNVDGDVWVVSADEGKVLHQGALEGKKGSRGSIAVVDGMAIVRSGETLFAFDKGAE